MKKQGYAILMAFILIFALTGCGNKSLLSAKEPVELTMWHVYGEQAGSPMDTLVEEFNRTAQKSIAFGFRFDPAPVAAKVEACRVAQSTYRNGLVQGQLDPETYLPEFLDALEDAGIDEVISEKQRQLDEWLLSQNATNGMS